MVHRLELLIKAIKVSDLKIIFIMNVTWKYLVNTVFDVASQSSYEYL